MPSATIGKQFTFHAAHQLPNHDGQCRRLHGHSYVLEVLVTGLVKPADGSSDEGMVMDFQVLKTIYKEYIEPLVEHESLNEAMNRIKIILGVKAQEVPSFPYSEGVPLTTCENLAGFIWGVFTRKLQAPYQPSSANKPSVCIRLWETPTSFAEVGKAPWRG